MPDTPTATVAVPPAGKAPGPHRPARAAEGAQEAGGSRAMTGVDAHLSLPASVYRTIVADPPWQPVLGGTWGARVDKGRPQRFYGTMPLEDIKALRVPSAPQSHLYLWCLSQHVDWGYEVARAWGFEPVITLTWCKDGLGVGRFRCNTEHVVVGRRGSRHGNPFGAGGRNAQALAGTWFAWPRGRHSEKPAEFYEMVTDLSPGPYLEMFARVRRPGWHVWGNQVGSDVGIAGWAPPAEPVPRPVPVGQGSLFDEAS